MIMIYEGTQIGVPPRDVRAAAAPTPGAPLLRLCPAFRAAVWWRRRGRGVRDGRVRDGRWFD